MLSWTQSQEWLEEKHDLASFTMLEPQLKASVGLGLSDANQMGVSLLLELDGPSCVALGEVSSIDELPHSSGKGCHLFGHGDHFGTGLGEVVTDDCSPDGGALAGGADGGDCPNKTW